MAHLIFAVKYLTNSTRPYLFLIGDLVTHCITTLTTMTTMITMTITTMTTVTTRPSQLAELSHTEIDQELFSHSAYVKLFCDIRNKNVVFNILQKNETVFDI